MKLKKILCSSLLGLMLAQVFSQSSIPVVTNEKLLYHPIQLDATSKTIIPWYSPDLGKSYDFVINATWQFWDTMRMDKNGLPYYMNHQVWRGDFNDRRGVGGDQFAMALSSFNLLYSYSGNEALKEEMKFIADYYLTHSLSPHDASWPNIPYPYNTFLYSGTYDGDMIIGKNYTQPDKAGSFGFELVKLYKMTTSLRSDICDRRYLDAAVNIANTLAKHTINGDNDNSPLPFKVNAITGEVGLLKDIWNKGTGDQKSSYTSNWSGTMELFLNLIEMKEGNTADYQAAFDKMLNWMKNYPLKTNKWGPFFEDIPDWSDTQINAITFAQFMMNHPQYFPNWDKEVKGIFNWVYQKLGNKEWGKYGVVVVNEQTAYQTPGNSHSSRQASAELQFAALTGDHTNVTNAIRQLNWATYMVNYNGENCYPRDEVWLTDGYGDYIRHYLRSMAFKPELAPASQNHMLNSSSVIQLMEYTGSVNKFLELVVPVEVVKDVIMHYRTYDNHGTEIIRLNQKPASVLLKNKTLPELTNPGSEGWIWKPLAVGGILTLHRRTGNSVIILSDNKGY